MIMVSYRRVDQDTAGRIADHLIEKYGERSVFFDVNSIRTGANFVDRIAKAIVASDIVIAVIGFCYRPLVFASADAEVAATLFVIDLPDLGGSRRLEAAGLACETLIAFDGD